MILRLFFRLLIELIQWVWELSFSSLCMKTKMKPTNNIVQAVQDEHFVND